MAVKELTLLDFGEAQEPSKTTGSQTKLLDQRQTQGSSQVLGESCKASGPTAGGLGGLHLAVVAVKLGTMTSADSCRIMTCCGIYLALLILSILVITVKSI